MEVSKLKEFLDANKVRYVSIHHSPAYTAREVAASAHVPGKELAKTVIVKLDGKLSMAVLPSSCSIDFSLLREATGARVAELATEQEFKDAFPGCELGAMPPFGNLYGMNVLVDTRLTEDSEIAFNACTHRELLRLTYRDFDQLVRPAVMRFSAG